MQGVMVSLPMAWRLAPKEFSRLRICCFCTSSIIFFLWPNRRTLAAPLTSKCISRQWLAGTEQAFVRARTL